MPTINVTQEHIDRGRRRMPNCCPVFHALRPLIKDEFDLSVIHSKAITTMCSTTPQRFRLFGRILQGKETRNHTFPEDVTRRIRLYDAGNEMESFKFELRISNNYIK